MLIVLRCSVLLSCMTSWIPKRNNENYWGASVETMTDALLNNKGGIILGCRTIAQQYSSCFSMRNFLISRAFIPSNTTTVL